MTVFKKFRKLWYATAAALLLGVMPLSVSAVPASQKSTSTKKQSAATKKSAAKSATQKTTSQKSAAKSGRKSTTKPASKSGSKSSSKKNTTKNTAKKSSSKSTSKKSVTKKSTSQADTKKNTASTSRQTTVIGAKPTAVQADTYDDRDSAAERKKADDLLMSAMGLLGVSYRFGGSNPASGLDCSGFIQYIFREAMNVNLPRTSAAMAEVGVQVEKSNLKPGDLVFFARGGKRIDHVGMYIGDGKFIHSPRTGKSIEIQNLDKAYYVKNYAGARRISNTNRAARLVQ